MPVDKHVSVKILPYTGWVKGQIFKFRCCQYFFAEIYTKHDFSLNAWVQSPGVDLGGEANAKMKLFRNMVMLHIK